VPAEGESPRRVTSGLSMAASEASAPALPPMPAKNWAVAAENTSGPNTK